jgi:hypothetical protein
VATRSALLRPKCARPLHERTLANNIDKPNDDNNHGWAGGRAHTSSPRGPENRMSFPAVLLSQHTEPSNSPN